MPKRNPPTCRGKIPRGLTHTHATQKGEPKREPLIMPTVARVIVEWLVPTILLHPLHIQLEPPPSFFFPASPRESDKNEPDTVKPTKENQFRLT